MKLICEDCKHELESEKNYVECPKCKGYMIPVEVYEALHRVEETIRAMGK